MAEAKDKRIFLIDGHALVFKMYYALLRRPMVNSKGVDTSILYGFTKYLLELIDRQKPEYLAVAFDPPGGSFRNKLYPAYKANRDATPQLVIDALDPLCEICRAMDIPVLMIPGFEADDVVGSMAKRAEREGLKVYMVTPDKDYGQLVSPNIYQYKPPKSGSDPEILDCAAVCAKYGIDRTEQVIDMLAICGDASDNVPGVKGVGEVGAGKLIRSYGSLEGIYEHIDELSPRQKQMFEEARDHIDLSKVLVTIKTDIEIDVPTESMAMDGQVEKRICELFDLYEFGSLKRYLNSFRIKDIHEEAKPRKNDVPFREVSAEEICRAATVSGCCAIVPEGKDSLAVAVPDGKDAITAAVPEGEEMMVAMGDRMLFRECLNNPDLKVYCCDIKEWLKDNCIAGTLMDCSLMDYVNNPEKSHRFDSLVSSLLGVELKPKEVNPTLFGEDESEEDDGKGVLLACAATLQLGRLLETELARQGLSDVYLKIEEPLIRVLAKMEKDGVKMDLDSLRSFATGLREEVQQREEKIRAMAGNPNLNISSPKQIAALLYDELQLLQRKKKGNDSTDEDTLLSIEDRHPIVREILEFRAAKKLLSTYIEPFPGYISRSDGKIHTCFNQALTATGRLSSSNPNLQNIPIRSERGKEIRKAFVPSREGGVIMSADYSQIELRIMAHLSQDRHLIEAFNSGLDVHKATAAKIFGIDSSEVSAEQRRIAKTANFGIMYGISAFGLSQRLSCSRAEAKQIIDDYFESFPAIRSFIEDTLTAARENGYVETIFGRRRFVPDVNSRNGTVRALAERNAVNAPIQGTSADIIKMAMAGVDRRLSEAGLKSRMVLQIHDELLFDALEEEIDTLKAIVVEEMENVVRLSVPLTVECDYGKNWLEAH
ncbi:MAG: DNA polymerase I [Candidatus Cryptobacteroides sp.]|nr:DNA polymerase I [Bacteroidales bacterium]MDY5744000.1 DNA polymerase I [Candidatus Cryptobacteroides sp.]